MEAESPGAAGQYVHKAHYADVRVKKPVSTSTTTAITRTASTTTTTTTTKITTSKKVKEGKVKK